jgi:outer membrane usher protein
LSLAVAGLLACAPADVVAQDLRLEPLEVLVNGTKSGSWVLLNDGGRFYAPKEALEAWRIQRTPRRTLEHRRQVWYALDELAGYAAVLDPEALTIDLQFAASIFAATALGSQVSKRADLSSVIPLFFAGYDLSATAFQFSGGDPSANPKRTEVFLGGLGEIGFSNASGVWANSFIFRGSNTATAGQGEGLLRLETNYTRDFPEQRLTLRVGDAITRGSATGRAVYFGGIQIGRNFRLAPGYVTQPLPTLAGSATTPSTVQLYINNVLRQSSVVPPGPFAITNPPVISGTGDVRLVVRDALGRETVVSQTFSSSPELLEEGLTDWSLEAGSAREGIGSTSSRYTQPFATGVYRHGLSKRLTVEGRATATQEFQVLGAALNFPGPWRSLIQTALVASQGPRGFGHSAEINIDQQIGRHSLNMGLLTSSTAFTNIGLGQAFRLRDSRTLAYSYNSERMGSLGLSSVSARDASGANQTAHALNYGLSLGQWGALSLSVSRLQTPIQPLPITLAFLTFSLPLDGRRQASLQHSRLGSSQPQFLGTYQHLNPEAGRWSWRGSLAQREGGAVAEVGATRDLVSTLFNADFSASQGRQGARLGINGGLVFVDGGLYATRNSRDSMAIIEVGSLEGVAVRSGNSKEVRTAANGRAVLTGLQPYMPNPITIDAQALPLTAELDSLEMSVTPPFRGGVRAKFPIRLGRAALIRLVLDDGNAVPPGALVRIAGEQREFQVARRGEVYLSAIPQELTIEVHWRQQQCRIRVTLPQGHVDEISRVGPLTCSGVSR